MNIDYENLAAEVGSGYFRQKLTEELTIGFRLLHEAGETIPLPSYYATKIAEIVDKGSDQPIDKDLSFDIYQEILLACEAARREVLGEEPPRPS